MNTMKTMNTATSPIPKTAPPKPESNPFMKPFLALALLTLAPLSHADIITIGDGVHSKGRFNGTDEAPFVGALHALSKGGVIEVLAGDYLFQNPVTISTSGISIRGTAGSRLVPAPAGSVGLFDVTTAATRVRFTGLRIETSQPAAAQSAIVATGDGIAFDHCSFIALGGASDFRFIDIGDGVTLHSGTLLESNTFRFSDLSAGVIGYRGRLGMALRANGNTFDRVQGATAGLCRYALELRDESKGTLDGNSFMNLGSASSPIDAAIWCQAEGEGHHFAISGNVFDQCAGQQIIDLRAGRFCAITGNSFGELPLATNGAIRLSASLGGKTGESNVITGNQFHAVALGIQISSQKWNLVNSNQFTVCTTRQIDVFASAQGVSIVGNQFVAAGTVPISEAIRLLAGIDFLVHDNVTLSETPLIGFSNVVSNSSADTNILSNWQS